MARLLNAAFVSVAAALAADSLAAPTEYVRPELLVSPAELSAALDAGGPVVVLHAGGANAIPGATAVDVAEWKGAFGEGTDAAGWGRRIGAAGIGPDARVVVYDNGDVKNAARVWWILRYWGVEQAALLDGGMAAWDADRRGVVPAARLATPHPKPFVAVAQPDRLRTTDEMILLAQNGGALLIDTRSHGEVNDGTIGAQPQHCEWVLLVDPQTRRFKPAAEIAALLRLDDGGEPLPVVTYCRSGGRASVTAFALELMGVDRVANYHGSWNEWTRRGGGGE